LLIRDDGDQLCPLDRYHTPPNDDPTPQSRPPTPIYHSIVIPDCEVPQWLQPYVDMFMADGMGQLRNWTNTLSLWLLYESKGGYPEVEGPLRTQMEDVSIWARMGRDPDWRPATSQYDSISLNQDLQAFWDSICPSWYSRRWSFRSLDEGPWQDWRFLGKTGFLDLFAAFFFVGRTGVEECEMPGAEGRAELNCPHEWYDRLDDLSRILTRLIHGYTEVTTY
jgi:hypothetical protein